MTPAAKPSAPMASWAYAENFISPAEAQRLARETAYSYGLEPVSRGAAQSLSLLAYLIDAKAVVEIGTGAGVASLALFQGMNPQGILTSIDAEPDHQQLARQYLAQTGIRPSRYRLIAGRALDVLPRLSDGAYDLVLIDADPLEYGEYVEQALRLLRPRGVVALYHALLADTVAQESNLDDETLIVRETIEAIREMGDVITALLPQGDGLLVAAKRN